MRLRSFAAVLAFLMLAWPVAAQETTGGIAGVVRDAAQAVLPGTTVNLTGPAGTLSTVTDERGEYRFPRLPPGRYTVKSELTGFAPGNSTVEVTVGNVSRVEFTLALANVTETVEVTARSSVVDETSSSTSRRSASSSSPAAAISPTSSARRPARRTNRRRAAFPSTARPGPRTNSSSTASTRPTPRWARARCRCAPSSWNRCR